MHLPTLKSQEIPLDDPSSNCRFVPSAEKPFLATPAAIDAYGTIIVPCLVTLQRQAALHGGLYWIQVFEDPSRPEALWFIEDGPGGAITTLLPSDY
jgi:hypothetical protein